MRSRILIALFSLIALAMLLSMLLVSAAQETDVEPTLDPFPRPTDWEIIVAEQVFENGRMFYLAPNGRIWVMFGDTNEDAEGDWEVYADSWEEGMAEVDLSLTVPDGMHQPMRGFGLLWRENEAIRDRLGWALDPEFGHHSRYRFFEGEMMDSDGGMMHAPGTHALHSFYGRTFAFEEDGMKWIVLEEKPHDDMMDDDMVGEAEATEEASDDS